ncbi:LexA family protein [Bacteroidota bacterium]
MKSNYSIENLSQAPIHELYKTTKSILTREQLGMSKENKSLKAIYNELESRNRLDVYKDAVNDAAAEAVCLEDAMSGFRAENFRNLGEIPKYELVELLLSPGRIESDLKKKDFETSESIDILKAFGLDDSTFICSVAGESMIEASIFDGDTLIVDGQSKAKDGDIVVAKINGEMFVKRYIKKAGKEKFVSENKDYLPVEIMEDIEVELLGVVRSVMHDL